VTLSARPLCTQLHLLREPRRVVFMLGMSAASAYLAANLKPGPASGGGAAVVEAFMAIFGLLVA